MLQAIFLVLLFNTISCLKYPRHIQSSYHKSVPRSICFATSASLDKPKWAAGGFISDLVNALISYKPLFNLMKPAARFTLISTAESNGIPWRQRAAYLLTNVEQLEENRATLVNTQIKYPFYYTQEFHAYDNGNLNWDAAVECESATMSMALRVWPKDKLTAEEAQNRLRYSYLDEVQKYLNALKVTPRRVIDVGCSVGMSTFYLTKYFPDAERICGLDMSPYFLSVAVQRQKDLLLTHSGSNSNGNDSPSFPVEAIRRIEWKHGMAEHSPYESETFDLVSMSFIFHELPQQESVNILQDMYRLLSPNGGVLAITDNNPRSKVIQNLPPVLFTLMKSTEPWSDQYYSFDIEETLRSIGFVNVQTVETDPRHRTIVATKI